MPDISMCPSPDCPIRGDCYRNEASGTEPSSFRQSWIGWTWRQPGGFGAPVECDGYHSGIRAALQAVNLWDAAPSLQPEGERSDA